MITLDKIESLNILSKKYKIIFEKNQIDVDPDKRQTLFGSYDPITKTIRVYSKDRGKEAIFEVLLHEMIHAICGELCINELEEKDINNLGTVLADTFLRNKLIEIK